MESIYEGMFSTLGQNRNDSKDVRDFVKNVFKDRDFMKMKNDKGLSNILNLFTKVDESKGVPQNIKKLQITTQLRGKNRDYSGELILRKRP